MEARMQRLEAIKEGKVLAISLQGRWDSSAGIPPFPAEQLEAVETVRFKTDGLESWNSCLPVFVLKAAACCRQRGVALDLSGLPAGARALVALAQAVPERADARRADDGAGFLGTIGRRALAFADAVTAALDFTGRLALAFGRLFRGRARFRQVDFFEALSESGPRALGIVSLISVLVGTILAFLGAVQLKWFGAEIYVANLVGIGMMREMGALMTAVIMTGRTGAAFAARLGTMQVNEEIDALRTLAIDPMEFLVLPRVIALGLTMPLLAMYSNILGILGGAIIGIGMLDITPIQYYTQTKAGITLAGMASGLTKSVIFGLLVAKAC
jgi:phospholipid/cholesterol/gamma-HCH transport system permease protein